MTKIWRRFDTTAGRVGFCLCVFIVAVAVFGPLLAPHPPDAPVGPSGVGSSGDTLLGTDYLGRDVLSRLLYGGRSVLLLGAAATLLGYVAGLVIGLAAGIASERLDGFLMRTVDILLAFPALLVLLVLITGAGSSVWVLVAGVALVQAPGISRVARTATQEVAVAGYVEAARVRGESNVALLRREILPNIFSPLVATFGLRFTLSVVLIASVNFLGLGLQPPAADWGLMVSENRQILNLNPMSVLAPALMIGLLTVAITLVGDALAKRPGRTTRMLGSAT